MYSTLFRLSDALSRLLRAGHAKRFVLDQYNFKASPKIKKSNYPYNSRPRCLAGQRDWNEIDTTESKKTRVWNCESRRDRHPLDTGEPTSEWHGIRGKQKHHYGGWMEEDQDFRSNEVLSIPTAGRFEITFVIWRHFEHHARRVSECVYASRSLFQISLYVIVQPHSRYQIRRTTHYLWTNDRET